MFHIQIDADFVGYDHRLAHLPHQIPQFLQRHDLLHSIVALVSEWVRLIEAQLLQLGQSKIVGGVVSQEKSFLVVKFEELADVGYVIQKVVMEQYD